MSLALIWRPVAAILFYPLKGEATRYQNRFFGLSLVWPVWLANNWLKLLVFMILATFSTTLVARPRVSGISVLMLLLVPTFMAFVWELRAFCRYVCPVSVFVGPFSRMSTFSDKKQIPEDLRSMQATFLSKRKCKGVGMSLRD